MWSLREPTDLQLTALLARQSILDFSYPHAGVTTQCVAPPGFDYDHSAVTIGQGDHTFAAACDVLRNWRQFPPAWSRIFPTAAALREGTIVILVIRALGIWWLNPCRIVYLIDEPSPIRRFGFAYGTLPGHVERGEEQFAIEFDTEGTVRYTIRAFSRPRMLAARLAYPIVRRLQKRFVRDSQAAVLAAISAPRRQ